MTKPTNNQENWEEIEGSVTHRLFQSKTMVFTVPREICDIISRQEIRQAKIEGMIEIQNILLNREDDEFVKVTTHIINVISNLQKQ